MIVAVDHNGEVKFPYGSNNAECGGRPGTESPGGGRAVSIRSHCINRIATHRPCVSPSRCPSDTRARAGLLVVANRWLQFQGPPLYIASPSRAGGGGGRGRRLRRSERFLQKKELPVLLQPGFFLPTGHPKPPASGSGLPVWFIGNRSVTGRI
jgi:hypothetical protein